MRRFGRRQGGGWSRVSRKAARQQQALASERERRQAADRRRFERQQHVEQAATDAAWTSHRRSRPRSTRGATRPPSHCARVLDERGRGGAPRAGRSPAAGAANPSWSGPVGRCRNGARRPAGTGPGNRTAPPAPGAPPSPSSTATSPPSPTPDPPGASSSPPSPTRSQPGPARSPTTTSTSSRPPWNSPKPPSPTAPAGADLPALTTRHNECSTVGTPHCITECLWISGLDAAVSAGRKQPRHADGDLE